MTLRCPDCESWSCEHVVDARCNEAELQALRDNRRRSILTNRIPLGMMRPVKSRAGQTYRIGPAVIVFIILLAFIFYGLNLLRENGGDEHTMQEPIIIQ